MVTSLRTNSDRNNTNQKAKTPEIGQFWNELVDLLRTHAPEINGGSSKIMRRIRSLGSKFFKGQIWGRMCYGEIGLETQPVWQLLKSSGHSKLRENLQDSFFIFAQEIKSLNVKQQQLQNFTEHISCRSRTLKSESLVAPNHALCQIESNPGRWSWPLSVLCFEKMYSFLFLSNTFKWIFVMDKSTNVNLEHILKSCESHRTFFLKPFRTRDIFRNLYFSKYPWVLSLIWT